MARSRLMYVFNDNNFTKLENRGGFIRNGLMLLVGKKLLKDGTFKDFPEGWYDTNLNLISNITDEDLQQLKEWGDIPY